MKRPPVFAVAMLLAALLPEAAGCRREPRDPTPAGAVVLPTPKALSLLPPLVCGHRSPLPDRYWNLAGYWEYDCTLGGWDNSNPCSAIHILMSDATVFDVDLQGHVSGYCKVSPDEIDEPNFAAEFAAVNAHFDPALDAMSGWFAAARIDARGHLIGNFPPINGAGPRARGVDLVRFRAGVVNVLPAEAIRRAKAAAGLDDDGLAQIAIGEFIADPGIGARRKWRVTLRGTDDVLQAWEIDVATGEANPATADQEDLHGDASRGR